MMSQLRNHRTYWTDPPIGLILLALSMIISRTTSDVPYSTCETCLGACWTYFLLILTAWTSVMTTMIRWMLTTSRPRHPTITWPLIVVGERNAETERYIVSRIERSAILNLTSHGEKLRLAVHHGKRNIPFGCAYTW